MAKKRARNKIQANAIDKRRLVRQNETIHEIGLWIRVYVSRKRLIIGG